MLRALTILFIGCLAVGCATARPPAIPPAPSEPITAQSSAEEEAIEQDLSTAVVATALLFGSPQPVDQMPLDLSRDARGPGAFVGYEETTSTYFYIRTHDRQTGDGRERYERRAIIEKTGAVHR